jgi:hypothetical protein
MTAMAAKNADEIAYRRDVINSAVAKKRAETPDVLLARNAVDAAPSPHSNSSGAEGMSFPPLSNSTTPAGSPGGPGRRRPLSKHMSVLEATHREDSLSWKSTNIEFFDTLVKDFAPPLLQPTRSMHERIKTMEERAMWNAHKMTHHRHHLGTLRVP